MSLIRLFFLAVGLLWGLSPALGHAQAGGEPAGYREAIESALEEMQLGNFVEAREQFTRAHALFPNARTLRGLGVTEFELKHYTAAVEQLRAALSSETRPLEGDLRRQTEALLKRAGTYVGELVVSVSPNGATLLIDGIRRVASLDAPLALDAGDHTLEFRARDHAPERRQVTIRGGQTHRLELQLSSLSSAQAGGQNPQSPAEAPRADRTPGYKRWWVWTIVGVVVAGAAVGTVIALKTKNEPDGYSAVPTDNTPAGAGLMPLWRR